MRALIGFVLLSIVCMAQPQTDAKGLYEQAMNKLTGAGISRNDNTGVDLMTRSAEMGYVPAQIALAYIYEVGGHAAAEPTRAAEWYRKAADRGDHLAQYLLGRMYFTGEIGGGQREGEKWLQSSADAGNPFAAYLLGRALYDREPAQGIRWLRVGAEQGLPYSQFRLAKALLEARSGPVNRREAYEWLFIALQGGVSEAESDLNAIEGILGSTETEKAKSEARDLQPKVRRALVAKGCTGWPGELDPIPAPPPLDVQRYCD
jgi:uncharacterized protein